jgi:hypothetical protein
VYVALGKYHSQDANNYDNQKRSVYHFPGAGGVRLVGAGCHGQDHYGLKDVTFSLSYTLTCIFYFFLQSNLRQARQDS